MTNPRSAQLAEQYESAHNELFHLVESLSPDQWDIAGKNFPKRIDDGRMSAAQRVERVLIGHMRQHQGSIEAAIG